MADRTIPQRELRNNVASVLRSAEAGESFTVTVRGRPVARVGPLLGPSEPKVDVEWGAIERILSEPVDDDFAADIEAAEGAVGAPRSP